MCEKYQLNCLYRIYPTIYFQLNNLNPQCKKKALQLLDEEIVPNFPVLVPVSYTADPSNSLYKEVVVFSTLMLLALARYFYRSHAKKYSSNSEETGNDSFRNDDENQDLSSTSSVTIKNQKDSYSSTSINDPIEFAASCKATFSAVTTWFNYFNHTLNTAL